VSREAIMKAVNETFEAMSEGRWDDGEYILRNTTEDFEWWVAGTTALSGTSTRAAMMEAYKMMPSLAERGITITPTSWIIDGDNAAVEAESYMKLRDGREYRNQYHFVIQMRGDKIRKIKEYMDTTLPEQYFLPPAE